MTQSRGQTMTHFLTRTAAGLALLGVLVSSGVACGRYGPPQPYPPGVEEPDEETKK
jgi:hypothetical protein